MEVIAPLIGVALGGLLGWGGTLISARQQRAQSRATFLWQRRAEAYEDALVSVQRLMVWVDETLPIYTPAQSVPPKPQEMDDDLRRANARIQAWGTPEVLRLAKAWRDAQLAFGNQAVTTVGVEARLGGPSIDDRQDAERLRHEARKCVEALNDRIAAELQGGADERRLPIRLRPLCKDWTTDLENIANLPRASLDALCECHQLSVAHGTETGVQISGG